MRKKKYKKVGPSFETSVLVIKIGMERCESLEIQKLFLNQFFENLWHVKLNVHGNHTCLEENTESNSPYKLKNTAIFS